MCGGFVDYSFITACSVQIVQSCTRVSARASGSVVQIDVEQLDAVLRNEVEQMMNELDERASTGGGVYCCESACINCIAQCVVQC